MEESSPSKRLHESFDVVISCGGEILVVRSRLLPCYLLGSGRLWQTGSSIHVVSSHVLLRKFFSSSSVVEAICIFDTLLIAERDV